MLQTFPQRIWVIQVLDFRLPLVGAVETVPPPLPKGDPEEGVLVDPREGLWVGLGEEVPCIDFQP
jgi:hypothetical protein